MTAPDVVECTLDELAERARTLVVPGTRHLLGLTGAPGAGKSTVAAQLVARLGPGASMLVAMDGFHLAGTVLDRLGRGARKGAHDTFDDAGYAAILRRLRAADPTETVYAPEFRRELEEPIGSAIAVPPHIPLVITEGNYLLLDSGAWPQARDLLDAVWFLAPGDAVRRDRLVRRHEAFGKSPEQARHWALGSDERNAELIATTARHADLVVRLI
ncbi:nucleoside/nucleotide kinase family protein [Pengzhenrongella frigida]|uniref:Nucleoside/nucleotide kinase family protein n=1 Tax=Pengzhenrongella frigida TaxID=1259133 RepID=A0A4Q5N0P9_9MICO|nr:nucleoside/nucleotide kinase family protein [Cellulomonas sp. HLT2-17]RYV51610.1 nucleoside/nucleotide kinase family protein [Cellulomonas sp. HLT2-17]